MKIFIVKGRSGWETSWIAKAFTSEHAAKEYIVLATKAAEDLLGPQTQEALIDGEMAKTIKVDYGFNFATVADANFALENNDPTDFSYYIHETDLIG